MTSFAVISRRDRSVRYHNDLYEIIHKCNGCYSDPHKRVQHSETPRAGVHVGWPQPPVPPGPRAHPAVHTFMRADKPHKVELTRRFHGAPARVANLSHPYTVAPLAASAPDPKGRRQLVCMTRASSLARGLHPGRYIKKWLFLVLNWCTDARDHPGHYPPSSDLGHAPAYRGRHFLTQAVGAVGCDRHPASWRHHCARVRRAQRPFTGFRVSRVGPLRPLAHASKEFR